MGAPKQLVKTVVARFIPQDYPHLKGPAVMCVTIMGTWKLEGTYEFSDLVIHSGKSGGSCKGHIVTRWYEYMLRIVGHFGSLDAKLPRSPNVRSKKQFQRGATVTIGLTYGDPSPTVIEEVVL